MPIKRELSSEAFEQLEESDKELYEQAGDVYKLITVNVGALKRAKDHQANERKKALAELHEAREKLKDLESKENERQEKKLKESGDFKEYEAKLKAKHAKELEAKEALIKERDHKILGKHAYDKAYGIAKEISTVPDLLADKIAMSLGAEYDSEGGVEVYVKDAQGKKSVDGYDVLTKKFREDTKYKDIIIQTKATGGASHGLGSQSDGSRDAFPKSIAGTSTGGNLDYTKCSDQQLVAAVDAAFGKD